MSNQPAKSALSGLSEARHRFAELFRAYPGLREIGIFLAALLVYQGSRGFVVGDTSTALDNAAGVVEWEKSAGLFFELTIQRWALENLELIEALNYFYLSAHWVVTTGFFVWLWYQRRSVYPYVRNAFLAANAIALAVFVLYPVAPPRLTPGTGFVDTLHRVSDVDLHSGMLSGWFNPYAAVPSMHFGYSIMIALVAMWLIRAWPLRFLALAYPAVVFLTIVGTGNHFVIDAVAGTLVIGAGFAVIAVWMRLRGQPIRAASGASSLP